MAKTLFGWAVYLYLIPLPALAVNTFGHVFWPAAHCALEPTEAELLAAAAGARAEYHLERKGNNSTSTTKTNSAPAGAADEGDDDDDDDAPWEVCLHFRIVTRGAYPELVSLGCVDAFAVLAGSDLPPCFRWCVEVATDTAIDAARLTGLPVREIVVPSDFKPPGGCRFKARALEWACRPGVSTARRDDWIIHMDEETKTTRAAVRHIAVHAARELSNVYRRRRRQRAAAAPFGAKDVGRYGADPSPPPPPQYGSVGQGAILCRAVH